MTAETMRAVVLQEDKTVKVQDDLPIPVPGPNEILIKVRAVGQNPTDLKHAAGVSKPGYIMGCDFVGNVVAYGSEVPVVRRDAAPELHDKVYLTQSRWGFVRGGYVEGKGAFAEYVTVDWDLTGSVPFNVPLAQAASIPIPFCTAVQAFYTRLMIPEYPAKANGEWILIWSGATAVGQYAIQLARLAGLKVATVASEHRWPLMKKLGAEVIVDYKDPDVVQKLKDGTGDSIQYGLDCISEGGSIQLAQKTFRPAGGHLVTLLPDPRDLTRPEVKTESTLVYTVFGEHHGIGRPNFKATPIDREVHVRWCALSHDLFAQGKIRPLEVEIVGGLEDVQQGFDLMKSGKHPSKLVYLV